MTDGAGTQGEFFYADSGYFADSLHAPQQLKAALRDIYRATSAKGPAAVAQRLMYGTDWEMIIIEGSPTDRYLRSFERIFSDLDTDASLGAIGKLSDNFFGANAANFLGLRSGKNRQRLQTFYSQQQMPDALWMTKA